ncbi:MAG: ABC transporter permease [Oligoflexia bacterium]|nr:ABC transporter permease [Oligoflexia bacterium]
MKILLAIILREFKNFYKNKILFCVVLFCPLILAFVLGGIFSNRVVIKMPVAVLDADQSKLSRMIMRNLEASRSFTIKYHVESPEHIQSLIYQQEIILGLVIPKHLWRDIKRGNVATVTAFVDGSNLLTVNLALADLKVLIATISAGIKLKFLQKIGSNESRGLALIQTIKTDISKLYNPGFNYLHYMAPGIWIAVLHQIILLLGSLLIVSEIENKTFSEFLNLSNHRWYLIIAGKLIPPFLISLLFFDIYFRVIFPLFAIQFKGSIPLMVLISALFSLCTLSLGLVISLWAERSLDAIKGVLLIGSPAFILSGYTWPTNNMPLFIQPISYALPLTPYLRGLRKVFQQGGSWENIYGDSLILILMTGTFLLISVLMLQKRIRYIERIERGA